MKKIIGISIVLSFIMMNAFAQKVESKVEKFTISTSEVYAIHEIELKDREHYEELIEKTNIDVDIIPLFVKDKRGVLEIISSHNKAIDNIEKGFRLVYLGKPLKS